MIGSESGNVYNSAIIGGCCNTLCCTSNSVIIGGTGLSVCNFNNTIFMNGTTNFRQTVEVSDTTSTITSTPVSISFTDGAVKYIGSLTTDFDVDFTSVPLIPNTTVTYTLILNQGGSAYMITGLTINTTSHTIKWANGEAPTGNADQVDIIGLMFIINSSGTVAQVLGQMGTFAS
jgi:hypothetical protein